jgi:hypothetical protein
MTDIKIILNIIKKEMPAILIGLILGAGIYFSIYYNRAKRKVNEKITFARIYNVSSSAKGHVNLEYYFLTQNGDTVKSSYYLRPSYNNSYYLEGKFLVKYAAEDVQNNEIILDKSY